MSFVADLKRKNELIHAVRRVGAGEITALKKIVAGIQDFPEDVEPTSLEQDSIERKGYFEVNEQEEEDRLGLTG